MPISTEADKETVRRIRKHIEGKSKVSEEISKEQKSKEEVLKAFGFKYLPTGNQAAQYTAITVVLTDLEIAKASSGSDITILIREKLLGALS